MLQILWNIVVFCSVLTLSDGKFPSPQGSIFRIVAGKKPVWIDFRRCLGYTNPVSSLRRAQSRHETSKAMRVDTAPYEEGIWEEEEPESDTLGKNAMAYLDKIRMLCEKNHIRLLLVKAPSKSPVWYDTWESQILEYASKYDLDYINFLNLVDEIGIDYNTDTYDQGLHMNLSGAEKCADYLGKFLSETYGLKDLRSDKTICSDWENKTIFYENMKKAQYKELKKYGEIVNY